MRPILVCVCVFSVGCSGQALNSPTSPTTTAASEAATSASAGDLPFRGSLTAREIDTVVFPTLSADGTAEGTATHLGRYSATFNATVNVLDGTATGAYTFTAANGDQLFATFTGLGVPAEDGTANITETLTITGGAGRFAGASGTLVVQRTLDQTTGVSTGSVAGSITTPH